MAWQKKYPGIAGIMAGPSSGEPSIAPVGEAQPALATKPMNQDLRAQVVPSALPAVPKLTAQPNMNEETKRRALQNIAVGHKGF